MKTLVKNGKVWVDRELQELDILLDGKCIVKIGKDIAADGAEVIDAAGKYVMPGVIDCHVHLSMDGSPTPMAHLSKQREAEAILVGVRSCKELVENGVTTIRECGGIGLESVILQKEVNAGNIVGPRIITCGKAIKIPGGHFFGAEVTGAQEAKYAARTLIKEGAQYIKLMATGGLGKQGEKPGVCELDVEEMKAAIDEGKKHGMGAAAHCHSKEGMMNAVEAGVTTLEHCTFIDEEIVDKIYENNVIVVPTFAPYVQMASIGRENGVSAYMCEMSTNITEAKYRTFHLFLEKGIKIAFGRDAGAPLVRHGDYVLEMLAMEKAGMSKKDIIVSATENAAEAVQVSNITGSITEGKSADIIILNGDPTADLSNYKSIYAVYAQGVRVR